MGGDHHAHTPKIPDWRIYTVGEHTPELLKNERMLKSLGLKDPWARNEVWRFDRRNHYGTPTNRVPKVLSRGFAIGVGLAVVTAAARRFYKSQHGHGHGHDGAHGGHH